MHRTAYSQIGIAILSILLLGATTAVRTPVRIMPIGDSITEGGEGAGSYRYYLSSYLRESGLSFDMVGSKHGGKDGSATDDSTFDQDHEGHWGWRADSVLMHIGGWAREARPDMALIHLGTNDFYQNEKAGISTYVRTTTDDLSRIIDTLRSVNPSITILIAQLIPAYFDEWIDSLNVRIPALAKTRSTKASRIIVVDQHTAMNRDRDFGDGLHPNDSGRRKMAAAWFKAIMAYQGMVPTPHFSLSATAFVDSVTIGVESFDSTATIRCSFDATAPTVSSPIYAGPVHLRGDTALTMTVATFSRDGKTKSRPVSKRIVVAYDTTAPRVERVAASSLRGEILVTFPKLIDSTSACAISGYSVSGGIIVKSARLLDSGTEVLLATSKLTRDRTYTVTIRDVKDRSLRANRIAAKTEATCIARATGMAIRRYWLNVKGDGITALTKLSTFPEKPDGRDTVYSLAGPIDWKDSYGSRINGYLYPPVTGAYTFWISADDVGELRLSTDTSVAGCATIAYSPGWTGVHQWDKAPEQRSKAIMLDAAKRYYFECTHVEGMGGDHVDVAWQTPGGVRSLIRGVFIAPAMR